ncbi:MAG: LPXTG cell wall anchor domain-containing protein [Rhodoluna sp.]|nr:LPXTG cell wall anchor domain-containing protein [Rhodoluna sp.]
MKTKKVLVALIAIGSIFSGSLPASATFNVVEPFSTEGALSSDWVVSGSVQPSIVKQVGDTPENALRITTNSQGQNGYVLYDKPFNLSQGVQFEFTQYQWGGSGADGIVFFIKNATDTTNVPGGTGGAMGYAVNSSDGISGALLGVGFDAWGNFKNTQGSGCDPNNPTNTTIPNQITILGPGQGTVGYCQLVTPYDLAPNAKKLLSNSYADRLTSAAAVKIIIESPYTDLPKVKVYYEDTLIHDIALPTAFSSTASIKFGFTAGTGWATNFHEVSNLRVKTLDATLPFRDVASDDYVAGADDLANTGGSLSDYYLLIGSAMVLIGGGIFSMRKGVKAGK